MNWEQRVRQLEKQGLTRSDAQSVVDAEDEREKRKQESNKGKNAAAMELGAKGGAKRAKNLTKGQLSAIGKLGAAKRWAKKGKP